MGRKMASPRVFMYMRGNGKPAFGLQLLAHLYHTAVLVIDTIKVVPSLPVVPFWGR